MDQMDLAGEFFRSQPMSLVSISIPKDYNTSFKIMEALVTLGCLQFLPETKGIPEHLRRHHKELLSCAHAKRQIEFLVGQVNSYLAEDPDGTRTARIFTSTEAQLPNAASMPSLDDLKERVTELQNDVVQKGQVLQELNTRLTRAREHRYVVDICSQYLKVLDAEPEPVGEGEQRVQLSELDRSAGSKERVFHICGTIHFERAERFRAHLFRVTKGLAMTHLAPLSELLYDEVSRTKVEKSIFVVWLTSENIAQKVEKICTAFQCAIYECPRMGPEQMQEFIVEEHLQESDMSEIEVVIQNTIESNVGSFWEVAHSLGLWADVLKRHQVTFENLNKCKVNMTGDMEGQHLQGRAWLPTACVPALNEGLLRLEREPGDQAYIAELEPQPEDLPYPTYFATNRFTKPLLVLVEKYGAARYQEANPALFAMAFFPFQFGIMFGDILHGLFLLIFALLCIGFEKRLARVRSEIFVMPFGARYLILTMAICSIYMGFIYNEIASVPLDWFGGSSYSKVPGSLFSKYDGSAYYFGVDPVWRWSGNNVNFTNSLKMKNAVIFGILQMSFGVLLKLANALHPVVGNRNVAIHESIPELVIYCFPFGYLIMLIFIKWATDWENMHQGMRGPPSILSTLINLAMFGTVKQKDVLIFPGTCDETHIDQSSQLPDGMGICTGQTIVQYFILACALVCVPWLLLGKPFAMKADLARARDRKGEEGTDAERISLLADTDMEVGVKVVEAEDGVEVQQDPAQQAEDAEEAGDGHDFAAVMVHQSIHTIEYCLGAISNTASYLRLWALSLAHSQLSEVFWDYIFNGSKFSIGLCAKVAPLFLIVACYFIWFCATMMILMGMESLSAFLHALRLQWVEFQTKFYAADGVSFQPANFDVEDDEN